MLDGSCCAMMAKSIIQQGLYAGHSFEYGKIDVNCDFGRIYLIAQCRMDLSFFPMDQQMCSLEMASCGCLEISFVLI